MAETTPSNDCELVRQTIAGDDDAFRCIVDRYKGPVYASAYALTRNAADAADVTQETFIRLHKHIRHFDPRRPLKPYLITIAMNTARTSLARRLRRSEVQAGDEVVGSVPDHGPAPSRKAAERERRHVVRRFLEALPDTMRRICVMFYLGEQSCREVAEALNMTENAVKVNLHRARKKLMHSGLAEWRTL